MKSNHKLWTIDDLLLIYDREDIVEDLYFLETSNHYISIKVLGRENILYQTNYGYC